jgi:hypothetical protein
MLIWMSKYFVDTEFFYYYSAMYRILYVYKKGLIFVFFLFFFSFTSYTEEHKSNIWSGFLAFFISITSLYFFSRNIFSLLNFFSSIRIATSLIKWLFKFSWGKKWLNLLLLICLFLFWKNFFHLKNFSLILRIFFVDNWIFIYSINKFLNFHSEIMCLEQTEWWAIMK